LPPENASGNFVKVVQRVPVKIVFDEPLPADKVIGPGLSVYPSVQTAGYVPKAWFIAILSAVLALITAVICRLIAVRQSAAK
jgi:membrane fusion protein, multidrug efflux system